MPNAVNIHTRKIRLLAGAALSCAILTAASSAFAADTGDNAPILMAQNTLQVSAQPIRSSTKAGFSQFAPKSQTKRTTINYDMWDAALANVVLDLGPSARRRAGRPQAQTGTRRVTGHKSAYRLEGSRVTFAYMNDEYRESLKAYRLDLEDIANRIDISRLSRDEQLAFWLNFHNAAMIEMIASEYPAKRPQDITVKLNGQKYPLHDAPFITIRGQAMSLRDIREQIVYPNWSDPNVIYGFYLGDIGSPKMANYAYKAGNLDYVLNRNAEEFINSLRGFNMTLNNRNVSEIYEDVRRFYFTNWDTDLQAHLLKYAKEEVEAEILSGKPFRIDQYDDMISDLSGGQRLASSGRATSGQLNMSYETARLLGEVQDKQEYLRRNNVTKKGIGYVIIEDLVPEDQKTTEQSSTDSAQ
jgi:hypothetical protein